VGLTKDISWARNKQWMQLLAEAVRRIYITQPEAVGAEQKAFIKQCFTKCRQSTANRPSHWIG